MKDGAMEVVWLKFISGPKEGEGMKKVTAWPPPEEMYEDERGVYVREAFSQLPDEVAENPSIMRGAVYRWERKSLDDSEYGHHVGVGAKG